MNIPGLIAAALLPVAAFAQLATPSETGVSMGHLHFMTQDPEAHRKFWTMLGAKPGKAVGPNESYKVQNALVLVRKQDGASGGSMESVVHHVGFRVFDLANTLDKCRASGVKILTPPEMTAKTHKANVMGPDDINVELVADSTLAVPIASHHIHFYNSPVEDTRAWYVKTFGAVPGKRDVFEAADIPGINLSFSASKTQLAPTKGRALDHIGFEVKNLEAFCKKLEAAGVKFDRPFTKVPALGLSLAFMTDPWGTYIELTEGLDQF
jgi:catechol 2,3-dioxygenase-like lactoylglutathione lyase family enzyme